MPDPPGGSGPSRAASKGEQWARVKELFHQALEQPADLRQAWLANAAGGDPALVRDVGALLATHDTAGDFLERPPAVDPADLHVFPPGTKLGPYEIVDELGRGGAGIVYLARDQRLGRMVALKLVAAGAGTDLRDRLRREARAAATIAHPSVATIHALEEFDDQLFIVSEYVRGRTLRALLADGPPAPDRALAIALDIARALRAAHDAGVVHRDLKPENVLVSDAGAVKVVDFGIARLARADATQLTQHGALLGTPAYMAPEQLLGTPADARADIYAFGIVLSEMITGHHPGRATPTPPSGSRSTPPERSWIARSTPAASADAAPVRRNDPTPALARLAGQCTQLDPSARIQTADLLVSALDAVRRGSHRTRADARWWWEFHQAAAAIVYFLALWPAWHARVALGGSPGRTVFIGVLAGAVVSACLRLHLWFTSRRYPGELDWVRRRAAPWTVVADGVLAVGLVSAGLLIHEEMSSLDVILLSLGFGAAVAFLVIEPATARAAFREGG